MRAALFARFARSWGLACVACLVVATSIRVGAAATPPFGPAEATRTLTARTLARQIQQDGPQKVVQALTQNKEWPQTRRAVATGWQNWIDLMPDLMSATDPATTRSLQLALRQALPRNPRAVVAALDPKNGPVRGGRTICAPAGMPATWHRRAIRAVEALHDIHLSDVGADCLDALNGRTRS
ncbi:hypothetical protein [Gluconacetobacter azotocaptans]|nr:hypothetical protein [Gluconacetobacter azotocaptans]GBQ32407.1 hypothetical protein AA13594_2370 [Gluconacetobacter azotocaptans DSM 13594]